MIFWQECYRRDFPFVVYQTRWYGMMICLLLGKLTLISVEAIVARFTHLEAIVFLCSYYIFFRRFYSVILYKLPVSPWFFFFIATFI